MQNVNACIITPSYPTKIEPYSAFFIRDQAVALKDADCKVSVVAPRIFGRASMVSIVDSIAVYNFSFLSRNKRLSEYKKIPILIMLSYLVSGIKKLFQVVRREHCNIIHAHWVLPSGFIAIIVGKYLLRKPVVITAHGSDITVLPRRSKIAKKLVKFTLKRADYIIAVSDLIKQSIVKDFRLPESKINVIRLGVDLTVFKPIDLKEARLKLRLPLDKKIILFVGDLVKVKGLNYLVEAIPELASGNPDLALFIVGEGSQKENLIRQAKQLNVDRYVIFMGAKSHSEIPLWMNAANILVLPSLSEGAPVSLMEASAVGLPIITTDVGGIPEIVKDGTNGFMVEAANSKKLAEKINLLLKDKALYLRMRKPIIGQDTNFDIIKTTARVKAIYQKILAKGKRSSEHRTDNR